MSYLSEDHKFILGYFNKLASSPAQLAPAPGQPASYGTFVGYPANIGLAEFEKGLSGYPLGARRTVRKSWIFLGGFFGDIAVGLAVADVGYAANAFAYLYLPGQQGLVEVKATKPFGMAANFDPQLHDNWVLINGKLKWEVKVENDKKWVATVEIPKLKLRLTLSEPHQGITAICPAPKRPFNFTYKNASLDAELTYELPGQQPVTLNAPSGCLDISKGYPPRQTSWNWAAAAGALSDGTPLGINLVAMHNNSLENVLWIGGQAVAAGAAWFRYNPEKPLEPWRIGTADGVLDMTFAPSGARSENLNLGLAASQFIQPFGRFEGRLLVGGREFPFTAQGVCEEHFALW